MSQFPPPRKAMSAAVKITVAVMLPLVATAMLVGGRAILPAVMALLSTAFVPYCTSRQAFALCAGLVGVGVLATVAYGNHAAVVALVVVTCVAAGMLSRISAGVFGVAPVVAAVMGMNSPSNPPLTVALVMAAVCAYVLLIVHLLKAHPDPTPVPFDVAVRHAVVMAVACGAATAIGLHYDMPKGYWLVMTLAIVLRPYAIDSLTKNRQRVLGTVLGAIVAVVLSPLPRPWQIVLAAVCMTLMFAYMAEKNYVLQVTFTTPMVVFLVSSGSVNDTVYMDGLRVLYTVGASIAGGLLSLALVRGPDAQAATPT
ncbi:MAG: FUSC family protein [Candidatus Nanopelagicales bacterium]